MLQPSPWVKKHLGSIMAKGHVLDIACGSGRHTQLLLSKGFSVTAVDRDVSRITHLAQNDQVAKNLNIVQADLEGANPWPFDELFDAIVVTNYLHRPLFPYLANSLAPGGILIYQTFMLGNEAYGKPSNPNFLLQPDELNQYFGEQLQVIAFEQGFTEQPKPAITQQLLARKPYSSSSS